MTRNGFRLAAVLRLRRIAQDDCTARTAAAHRDAIAADNRAARRLAELRASTAVAGPTPVRAFHADATLRSHRAAAVQAAELAAAADHVAHQQRIDELVQASTAVAALEKLEAGSDAQADDAERRDEAREINDLLTARQRQDRR